MATVEEHRFPKKLLRPDNAEMDEGEAWRQVVNTRGLNADMLTDAKHTATEYVWKFDRDLTNPTPED